MDKVGQTIEVPKLKPGDIYVIKQTFVRNSGDTIVLLIPVKVFKITYVIRSCVNGDICGEWFIDVESVAKAPDDSKISQRDRFQVQILRMDLALELFLVFSKRKEDIPGFNKMFGAGDGGIYTAYETDAYFQYRL